MGLHPNLVRKSSSWDGTHFDSFLAGIHQNQGPILILENLSGCFDDVILVDLEMATQILIDHLRIFMIERIVGKQLADLGHLAQAVDKAKGNLISGLLEFLLENSLAADLFQQGMNRNEFVLGRYSFRFIPCRDPPKPRSDSHS